MLSTDVWVSALLRRASLEGAFAVVARRGDARAGAVLVRVYASRTGETRLLAERVGGEGERVWFEPRAGADPAELEAYVQRAARIDPDLWVVDIEDAQGRHFLTEPVSPGPA